MVSGLPCAFLATHSSVAIDMFNTDECARIVHVTNTDGIATAVVAQTTISHGGIVDDLDVRASDILQSNCIVWVEGPSDRVYFNRWISLLTDNELSEGVHYQCLFYGGRLLAHLSAEYAEDSEADGVEILRANRHAILLIDSDRGLGIYTLLDTVGGRGFGNLQKCLSLFRLSVIWRRRNR